MCRFQQCGVANKTHKLNAPRVFCSPPLQPRRISLCVGLSASISYDLITASLSSLPLPLLPVSASD